MALQEAKMRKIISLAEGMQSGITPVIFHTNTGEKGEELATGSVNHSGRRK